jgi:hypothetical protein
VAPSRRGWTDLCLQLTHRPPALRGGGGRGWDEGALHAGVTGRKGDSVSERVGHFVRPMTNGTVLPSAAKEANKAKNDRLSSGPFFALFASFAGDVESWLRGCSVPMTFLRFLRFLRRPTLSCRGALAPVSPRRCATMGPAAERQGIIRQHQRRAWQRNPRHFGRCGRSRLAKVRFVRRWGRHTAFDVSDARKLPPEPCLLDDAKQRQPRLSVDPAATDLASRRNASASCRPRSQSPAPGRSWNDFPCLLELRSPCRRFPTT